MDYFLRFASSWVLYILIPLIVLIIFLHYRLRKQPMYRHALGSVFKASNVGSTHPHKKVFYTIRFTVLLGLALLIARPQLVDSRSRMQVEGIDIVLVLDVSGSMQFQDYSDDNRSRVEVAKAEAIRFIEKRTNDAIGLVIFGNDAISRCPITHDKQLLKDMVSELDIGVIDADGTMLATGIVTAANRLKNAKAKSKIMIVLTDGEPSQGDLDPNLAIEVAKKMGIKMYTVGIGSEEEQMFAHPLYGIVVKPKVNSALLKKMARETNGQFFMAHNARDMRAIYDTIDKLEKTEHDTPVFSKYHDIFIPFVFAIIALMIGELWLSAFAWFGI